MTRGQNTYTDTRTGEEYSYADYTDLDTQTQGTAPPFQPWESDSTALVHVFRSLRSDGLIAERPQRDEPLRRALFDRLFGSRAAGHHYSEGLIEDLRSILDAHDPQVTAGAAGARRLERAEVDALPSEPSPRQGGNAFDLAASVILRSRFMKAALAAATARALREAADEEAAAQGGPMVSSVERLLRRAHTHDGQG